MAEFAASIIGIVSAGTKVALVLSQLSADVGSAGHEARMIGGEIRSFCSVLKTLGEAIEHIEKSPRYAHCSEMIKDMTDDSLQMFTEILNAVDKLKKMTVGRDGRDGNFGLVERVQWAVFKKPKLLLLRAAIEAYKTNLTLMLSTLSTAERATRRSSTPNDAGAIAQDRQDRSLLHSLELDREATLIELAQAERQFQDAEPSSNGPDTASVTSPPAYDTVISETGTEEYGLMGSVRNEISSLRSSFPRTAVTDHEALKVKINRHSKRISSMLENDKERLSQRWSLTLQDNVDVLQETSPLKLTDATPQRIMPSGSPDAVPKPVQTDTSKAKVLIECKDEGEDVPSFDPRTVSQYRSFLSWILHLDGFSQQEVLQALRHDTRPLRRNKTHLTVKPHAACENTLSPSPVASALTLPLSPQSIKSTSTLSTDQQSQNSRSTSRRNRKGSALLGLHYVRPINTGAGFLSDRSQRPPGRKLTPVSPTLPMEREGRSPDRLHAVSQSAASVNTESSVLSTSRQAALARLTGDGQDSLSRPSSMSLPTLPSIDHTSSTPKIRVSKHRRSRSEHTLTFAKLQVYPDDHGASRTRSMHDLHEKDSTVRDKSAEPIPDSSDDEPDEEEHSSMWWRSLGNISPQPYRSLERSPAQQDPKRHHGPPEMPRNPHSPRSEQLTDPDTASLPTARSAAHRSGMAAHTHNRSVSIVHGIPQSRDTYAATG